jgi:DNA polymerase I-like protein with 3'-5' exonuclease and polymerase domains
VHHFGITPGMMYDTMLAEQCLTNGRNVKLGMKETAARYGLPVSKEEQTSTVDLDKKPDWDKPFREELIAYMAQDVELPHQLSVRQQSLLMQYDLQRVIDLEHAALRAVIAMEAHGARIDHAQVERIAGRKRQRQADLEQKLLPVLEPAYQRAEQRKKITHQDYSQQIFWGNELPPTAQKPFKLSSPEQVRVALAEIGVQVTDTKAETLGAVVGLHTCLPDLLEWKKLQTALTTFCTKLPTYIKADGRIHADFHTVVSGRYVTSQPNLQAIPKAREGEPVEEDPRRCIVAVPGHQLLAADLSTIELRILAEMANDVTMLDLLTKEDLHAETAKLMFHLPADTNTKEYLVQGKSVRQIAKQINFGLIYGMGALRLSNTTGVDLEMAKDLMTRYFATYQGVSAYLKRSGRDALRRGYAVSLSGRRRSFPTGLEPHGETYGTYERSAKNHPIQGTNADILKRALILLSERLPEEVFVVLTIHDEIVLESPEARIEEASTILQTCLLKACRDFLKVVAIPTPKVLVADYWKKD